VSATSPLPDVFKGKVFSGIGRNCCLSELQAAVVLKQLEHLDDVMRLG